MDDESKESTEQDDTTEGDKCDWDGVDAETGLITETTEGMINVIYNNDGVSLI